MAARKAFRLSLHQRAAAVVLAGAGPMHLEDLMRNSGTKEVTWRALEDRGLIFIGSDGWTFDRSLEVFLDAERDVARARAALQAAQREHRYHERRGTRRAVNEARQTYRSARAWLRFRQDLVDLDRVAS
jgi:hypothetical protein